MIDEKIRETAKRIGRFYLGKNGGDYDKATDELYRLQIVSIVVGDGAVTITTARPGMLIGMRGENVENLTSYLGMAVKIKEDPNSLYDALIPWPEPEYPNYYEMFLDNENEP